MPEFCKQPTPSSPQSLRAIPSTVMAQQAGYTAAIDPLAHVPLANTEESIYAC